MREAGLSLKPLLSLLLLLNFSSATLLMGIVSNTGSMRPTYYGGEHVMLEPADSAEVGDIIVFQRDNKLIIHRVIFEFEGCYITKGDATFIPDWGCSDPKYKVVA